MTFEVCVITRTVLHAHRSCPDVWLSIMECVGAHSEELCDIRDEDSGANEANTLGSHSN